MGEVFFPPGDFAGRDLREAVLGGDLGFLFGRLAELEERLGDLETAFLVGLGIPEWSGLPPPQHTPARAHRLRMAGKKAEQGL